MSIHVDSCPPFIYQKQIYGGHECLRMDVSHGTSMSIMNVLHLTGIDVIK